MLLVSALLLLAVQACKQDESDSNAMGSTFSEQPLQEVWQTIQRPPYDSLQQRRWFYRSVRRGVDPGISPRFIGVDKSSSLWKGHSERIGSRWAGFVFDAREDGTFIIEEDTSQAIILPWKNIGTHTSGRILSHAFDPFDRRTIWVGSASGGLFRTNDGGNSWQPVTDHLPSMAVSAVAVHPRRPDTLLIGTMSDFGMGRRIMRVDGQRRRFGYGVFRSVDGGQTWHTTEKSFNEEKMDCNQLVWDPVRPDTVYLASSNGVWQSADAGMTWQRVLRGNARSVVLNKRAPDMLYAALFRPQAEADTTAGIWHSTDAGANWTRLTEGLFDADSLKTACGICMHLTLADSFPKVVYTTVALNGGNTLYKTSNGGANWTTVQTPDTANFWKVHVSPVDTNTVFGGGKYLYRTRKGGASWEAVGTLTERDPLYLNDYLPQARQVHVDHHDFGFDPDRPDSVVYAFTDGGVFISTDGGDLWTVRNEGLATLQLYSLAGARSDTGRVVAGAQDQGQIILDSYYMDRHWQKLVTGDGMMALIHPQDHTLLYTTSQYGNHWRIVVAPGVPESRTAMGQVAPQPIFPILKRMQDGIMGSQGDEGGLVRGGKSTSLWVTPKVMDPRDPNSLYTATLDSVYTTIGELGSLRWQALEAIDNVSVFAVDEVDSKILYAYSNSKKRSQPVLWRSLDRGDKWEALVYDSLAHWPGGKVSDLVADPDRAGTLYAVRTDYKNQVWRSTDSAQTWVNITNNLSDVGGAVPVNTITITPKSTVTPRQIYIGTDVGVFMAYADEEPLVWQRVGGGLPHVIVNEIYFHPVDRTLRVGTYGRGYWKAKVPR